MSFVRLGILLLLSNLAQLPDAQASTLDIEHWLNRPGVKMVVVEFFASWCKPCMDAVPKWRELHDKYRKDGLRFIVVSTRDPNGLCKSPGWTPDEIICDDEGLLARQFRTQGRLPAAFLWGWQGHLLVQRGHIEQVETKILKWLKQTPRLDVEVLNIKNVAKIDKIELLSLVKQELRRFDKLIVVATEKERKKLRKIVKRSLAVTADESLACEVGREITANSLLKVSIIGRSRHKKLHLELFDAERGCLVASVSTRWNVDKKMVVVGEVVTALIRRLKLSKTQYPWDADKSSTSYPSLDLDTILAETKAAEQALNEKKRQLEKARKIRLGVISADWKKVVLIIDSEGASKKQKIQALEYFLNKYKEDNIYREDAEDELFQLKNLSVSSSARQKNVRPMVKVEAGDFFFGCNERVDHQCYQGEKPGKIRYEAEFWIDKFEVTVADYRRCVDAGVCSKDGLNMPFVMQNASDQPKNRPQRASFCNWDRSGRSRYPINCLNWYQARKYCHWEGKQLPTEFQWEKAARGTQGDKYSWGNADYDVLSYKGQLKANIADESLERVDPSRRTISGYDDGFVASSPVGQFAAGRSPYGAYDMIGNVWEWTTTEWDNQGKDMRVIRGGSWYDPPRDARASIRGTQLAKGRDGDIGVRCVSKVKIHY